MTDGFILLARNRADDSAAVRVGFTVTKKIGGAVVRNRLKRRLREAASRVVPGRAAGYDLVLIGRQGGLDRDFEVLVSDLDTAIGKTTERPAA